MQLVSRRRPEESRRRQDQLLDPDVGEAAGKFLLAVLSSSLPRTEGAA